MKCLAIAALIALPLCACNSSGSGAAGQPSAPGPQQRWVCGREFENFAWGYQRRGVVLDGEGHVWSYAFKGTPASLPNAWHAKDFNALSEDELRARYDGAVDTGQRVDPDDIARHVALIIDASKAQPTEGRQVGADMGATVVYCLARNVPYATYRQVLIDQKGDFDRSNPSSAAKALETWLAGIFK